MFLFSLISLSTISAAACALSVSMINQEPYPAIPGDYVKIVFQINGLDNPECGRVQFGLLEQYPLIFDPDTQRTYTIDAGTYQKGFSSFLIAPYKVRLDGDALNGDNPIEVEYRYGSNINYQTQQFNLDVEDTRADFEINVKDYKPTTKILTFEILNTAKVDVQALTVEIPEQETIIVKGPKTNIVGDLDSNEYTTADFEATPSEENITIKVTYTDTTNQRRTIEKTVEFQPEYFQDRASTAKAKTSLTGILFWILLVIIIINYFYKRHKKKKEKRNKLRR